MGRKASTRSNRSFYRKIRAEKANASYVFVLIKKLLLRYRGCSSQTKPITYTDVTGFVVTICIFLYHIRGDVRGYVGGK